MRVILIILTMVFINLSGCSVIKRVGDTHLGTAYSAHELCSRLFVSGEEQQLILERVIKPKVFPLQYVWNVDIDDQQKVVSVSAPFISGLNKATAVYRPLLGCTLLSEKTVEEVRSEALIPIKLEPKPIALKPAVTELKPTLPFPATQDEATVSLLQPYFQRFYQEDSNDPSEQIHTFATAALINGQLVHEQYAQGHNAEMKMLSWSMAKTITALLIGILIDDEKLSLDQPVIAAKDGQQPILLRQLLQMSSGLAWREGYKGSSDVSYMLYDSSNATEYVHARPQQHPPGEHYQYSTGDTQLLAELIRQTLNTDPQGLYDFYQRRLFKPLNIEAVVEHDESGDFIGGARMFMTTTDWLKIGQLLLQQGRWQGRQLVSADWINWISQPSPSNPVYGGQLWLHDMATGVEGIPDDALFLRGHLGQMIAVIPEYNLVLVRLGAHGKHLTPDAFSKRFLQDLAALIQALDG